MPPPPERLSAAVDETLKAVPRVVLAVSGGLDSMALLHLAARSRHRSSVAAVATFDHGTGPAATRAAALASRTAGKLGFPVVIGCSDVMADDEASWRDTRWRFLRDVAELLDARVVTAHTLDDQAETVFMRILRGSGTRGLAGLRSESDVVRPLLSIARAEISAWARRARLVHTEDPTNESRRHLRNRVRLEILPAILERRPGFRDELLDIGERAAAWRSDVERIVDELGVLAEPGQLVVPRAALIPFDGAALGVLWPALAARAGVILDRRGTDRLVDFARSAPRTGARIQLSGGFELIARRDSWLMRRDAKVEQAPHVLRDGVQLGPWQFRSITPEGPLAPGFAHADLPAELPLTVRPWRPGDRIAAGAAEGGSRKVKRFFADARIAGPERRGWPVVLAGDDIVWVPGVCRSSAATVRSGRPAVRFVCEHTTG